MELSYKEEVSVGVMVIAGLVVFTIGMFWLTGRSLTSTGVSVRAEFANVNKGLTPGQLAGDIHATLIATQRGMKALTDAANGPTVKQTQQTLAALERVMVRLDTLLGAANPTTTGKRLDTLSVNLAQLTNRLSDATGSLKRLLDKMDRGEGTLGKVATDTMLYKNLTETLGSLSELLKDLKERPGRYLTVKVF